MGYLVADHAQILILAGTVFNFHALAHTCSYRRLFKSMGCAIANHARVLILAGTVSNFYALAYTGVCLKLWVARLHTMHK